MRRLRTALVLLAAGAVAGSAPVLAFIPPGPPSGGTTQAEAASTAAAMALLDRAAALTRDRPWSAVQHLVTMRSGTPRVTVLRVDHTPGLGSAVQVLASQDQVRTADVLEQRLLSLLPSRYELRLGPVQTCAGRQSRLVTALRPGQRGPGSVAGRFWVDAASGLVLRREVLDESGSVVRSSALVDLTVGAAVGTGGPVTAAFDTSGWQRPDGQRLEGGSVDDLVAHGWPVLYELPSQLALFDARMHEDRDGQVLQLSYSDGLSTLSLFLQRGALPPGTLGVAQRMPGSNRTVWVSDGDEERVVWAGNGLTWTLVSDAPASMVDAVVQVLPHGAAPATHEPVPTRVWRGLSRVGSWLNPFD